MNKKYIEIFGDMIDFKDLIISIIVISGTTMVAHLLAPAGNRPLGLLFGLGGTIIGFIAMTLLVKVKRVIHMEDDHA